MGWSYEVTGLNAPGDPNDPNDPGAPTVISDSGTWTGLGLPETFVTDTLDNDCHASAFSQEWGNIIKYDRCTVSIGKILIDDSFDNEDLATGGINGGFSLVTNDPWGVDCTAVETGSVVEVNMVGPKRPAGVVIISNECFDPLSAAALAEGLSVKWEVSSILNPMLYANGNMYIVQTEPVFMNASAKIGLQFGGSGNNVRFIYNDNDPNGALSGESEGQPYAAGSELDGFTCEFTIKEMGWSYEVTGLNAPGDPNDPNDSGAPTVISNSGTWADLGVPETYLTDTLDNDCHASAFAQEWGNVIKYDRCTVKIKDD
jgi:hypothetical protein